MQVLALIRTVSIYLVGVSACFAFGANARQDEEPDTNSCSPMASISPTKARNYTVAPEENTFYADKNNESRTMLGRRAIEPITEELSDTSFAQSRISSPLHSIRNAVERSETQNVEDIVVAVANLHKRAKWRDWIEATKIPWEISLIRNSVLSHCLDARESPAHTFRYMRVRLITTDAQKYDPRLLWWLDYVREYRRLGGVSKIETTRSDTATSHGVFDDKKLFAFLVNEYDLQTAKATSSEVPSPDMTPPDSRQQVVALFESLRPQPSLKKLAEGMQLYLVSMSNTEHLVFHEWLQARVSPESVLDILHVVSLDDVSIVSLWLKYVKMYWNNVAPGSDEHYFYYDVFLRYLAKKFSRNRVTELLKSNHFRQMFNKAPHYGFGSHAKNLQALWTRWLWLDDGASPQDFFRALCPSGKIELGDLKFLQGILYVDLYRMRHQFTNEEVLDLLLKFNSLEEIKGLFRWLQEYSGMQDIATDMLKYLTSPSIRQDPHVTQMLQREGHLPQKKHKNYP